MSSPFVQLNNDARQDSFMNIYDSNAAIVGKSFNDQNGLDTIARENYSHSEEDFGLIMTCERFPRHNLNSSSGNFNNHQVTISQEFETNRKVVNSVPERFESAKQAPQLHTNTLKDDAGLSATNPFLESNLPPQQPIPSPPSLLHRELYTTSSPKQPPSADPIPPPRPSQAVAERGVDRSPPVVREPSPAASRKVVVEVPNAPPPPPPPVPSASSPAVRSPSVVSPAKPSSSQAVVEPPRMPSTRPNHTVTNSRPISAAAVPTNPSTAQLQKPARVQPAAQPAPVNQRAVVMPAISDENVEVCAGCAKIVFFIERVCVGENLIYHKECFRCTKCRLALNVGNFAKYEGQILCKPHYTEKFKLKGQYSEQPVVANPSPNAAPAIVSAGVDSTVRVVSMQRPSLHQSKPLLAGQSEPTVNSRPSILKKTEPPSSSSLANSKEPVTAEAEPATDSPTSDIKPNIRQLISKFQDESQTESVPSTSARQNPAQRAQSGAVRLNGL